MTSLLEVRNVRKRFGGVAAVEDLSLDIGEGEFFALLGPSGCGKTTLMRMIAGFEAPDAGRVTIGGVDMTGTPPHARPVNMMFQSYALFPHMSVEGNIAFGLRQARMPRPEIARRVAEMLRLVQLEGFGARRPDQLSGGQRQRVALARALARRPRLLLLDEPLAALDRKLREETRFELTRVQRDLGTSFMLVTHDQDEAMSMASRIAVMRAGRIEQTGAPRDIYDEPANRAVAMFVGEINLFETVVEGRATLNGESVTRLSGAEAPPDLFHARGDASLAAGQKVALVVRPEAIELSREGEAPVNAMRGEIVDIVFRGEASLARLRLPGGFLLRALVSRERLARLSLARGETVHASFPAAAGRVLAS